jgi:hypothetical protein
MARVAKYHTDSPEYPPQHRNVYHDRDDCHDGKAIKPAHRKSGDGGKPRCKVCIKLG